MKSPKEVFFTEEENALFDDIFHQFKMKKDAFQVKGKTVSFTQSMKIILYLYEFAILLALLLERLLTSIFYTSPKDIFYWIIKLALIVAITVILMLGFERYFINRFIHGQ